MAWDPKIYLAFDNERARPAIDLVGRIDLESPARIADLGCGPGNSTRLLERRWPKAILEGIDSSPDMLAEAAKSGVRANWIEADLAAWKPRERYDLIFSNATLQWLADHETLLPRLMSFVNEGGALAFQVPNNFDAPSHALMREVAADERWATKLRDVRAASVLTPEAYFTILEQYAVHLDIWETTYLHELEGVDAVYRWVSGTGLRPFVNALEGEERAAFIDEYKKHLRAAYPMRLSGKTLLPFARLFCVARKP